MPELIAQIIPMLTLDCKQPDVGQYIDFKGPIIAVGVAMQSNA